MRTLASELGPLRDPHLTLEPEPLRPGPRVGDQQRGQHGHHARDHCRDPVGHIRRREQEGADPDEGGAIAHPVEGGVVEGPERGGAAGAARDRAVEHVEDRREADDPAGDRDVPHRVDHAAGHRAERADRRDGVRIDAPSDEEVRHRLDEPEIAVLDPLPQVLHAPGRGKLERASR